MGRNIILLSDGTGNSASKLQKTNVWRLYDALDLNTDDQVAQYDEGVGTSPLRPVAALTSAFGIGLARNVRDLYFFLSRNYHGPDDRIYAFGFSRGAFTIRVLIGLVRNQGLVDRRLPEEEFKREVVARYKAFRAERFQRFRTLRARPEQRDPADIEGGVPYFEFVGLWDTVAAYGLPIDELQHGIDLWIYPMSLPDRKFSRFIKSSYHVLALDDARRTFHPMLWDEKEPTDRLQQVWFSGVHANVGGGYPKDGLAHVSLEWMMGKAQSAGLKFIPSHVEEIRKQVDAHDELYNSRAGLAGYYRYAPRPVTALGHDSLNGVEIKRPKVHCSVFARITGEHVGYAPIGVPPEYDLVLRDGTVVPWEQNAARQPNQRHFSETPDEARPRAEMMEATWNVAWLRHGMYFTTLFATLFLVALALGSAADGQPGWLADKLSTARVFPELTRILGEYLGPPLIAASYLVPKWVSDTWLATFKREPLLSLLGVAAVAVTMMIGLRWENLIHSRASDIWHRRWQAIPKWAANPKASWIYKLRTNALWVKTVAWVILPTAFILFCLTLLVWIAILDPRAWVYYALIALAIMIRNWINRDYKLGKKKAVSPQTPRPA